MIRCVIFKLVGVITPTMAIKRHKRGERVYLSEYKQVREGKKVKSLFMRYLGPEDGVKAGKKPRRVLDKIQMSRSHRAGDVRLLWEIAKDLDFAGTIDRICCQISYINGPSPGKFLTAWAINRAIDPESCTQLERWIPTTDLPVLTGIEPELFTKDALLSSLDFICCYDDKSDRIVNHSNAIDDALYQNWRSCHPLPTGQKETVAYDITSVLFFGVTCPIAELGFNPKKIKRLQVNLALLVSKYDKYPISHFIYEGSRQASSTVNNLIARLQNSPIKAGTIIWDRGNVSKDHIEAVTSSGWKLICAVPKTSNEVRNIISNTKVPLTPDTFVHKGKHHHIYAIKAHDELFGTEGSVIVYLNHEKRTDKINDQNLALAEIGRKLDNLSETGKEWTEAKLHKEIKAICGSWKDYIHTRVKRKGNGPRVEWRLKKKKIAHSKRSYGRYLLLSTDNSLTTGESVKTYFEKDFIEKVFRTLRTNERIEPVRHRLAPRVCAYMFICVLAYRLLSVLHFRIEKAKTEKKEGAWEQTYDLLHKLGRVERTEVGFGNETRTWYLNVTTKINKVLKSIGMKNLLKEEIQLKV